MKLRFFSAPMTRRKLARASVEDDGWRSQAAQQASAVHARYLLRADREQDGGSAATHPATALPVARTSIVLELELASC